MGNGLRWMTGALVGVAMVTGSIGTAQARPYRDRGWHHHYRDRDRFGVGDAIGVAALVGAVAIVASSLSKDRKAAQGTGHDPADRNYRDQPGDDAPPTDGTDYGADMRGDAAPGDDGDFSDLAAAHDMDDRMTDACALAARDEAQARGAAYAEIRRVDAPRAATSGGYNVDGEVESRTAYRAAGGETRRFTCAMNRDGRVVSVYLSRDLVLR
ncbi:hypothetical protein J3E64_001090 [Sphingobium sp. OAS761]|uniref:hypothetical protein n=1 Tax=Sphingobium sp. OAS761 TaxID=2817901 RepID=UPI00209EE325|nr:hypothetical protein [Sphingobium sp. OAS761]MCP1469415.1 hypothetical protein [Sphingobium sp. OAS761]